MNIRWEIHPLPASSREAGHGLCLCHDDGRERRLVAHVDGFGWYHVGADALVRYAPDRIPAGTSLAALQAAVANHLRTRSLGGNLGPGLELFPNA